MTADSVPHPAAAATLLVRVVPRAGRTAVGGRRGDALLVRLSAAPVDGAANAALIDFLAALLGCRRRDISIVSGATSRDKRLRIGGLTAAELERRVSAAIAYAVIWIVLFSG